MTIRRCFNLAYVALAVCVLLIQNEAIRAADITGTVYDYYGTTPVGGVAVQCLDYYGNDTTVYESLTGPQGRYTVSVPAGVYIASVNPNGGQSHYLPQYHLGVNSPYYTDTLAVTDDAPLSGIDFYLLTGYVVKGSLKNGSNQPVGGSLYAYDNTTGYYFWGLTGYQTEATGEGSFTLNLPQGVFTLIAYPDSGAAHAEILTVHVNDSIEGLNLVLPGSASISGTVTIQTSQPVSSIRVDAIDSLTGYSSGSATTDASGAYTIGGLPVGRSYRVLARSLFHPEYLFWTSPGTFHPSATNPSQATLVTPVGGGTSGIDIIMPDGFGVIRGKVKDTSGAFVSGAYVYDFMLSDALNSFVPISQRATYTNDAGEYELTGIGPGRVGIAVTATGYLPQIYNGMNRTTTLALATPLEIESGETLSDVNLLLTPVSDLGAAPVITAISPHLIFQGDTRQVTIKGTNFDAGATIELIDDYYVNRTGTLPVLSNAVISPDTVLVTLSTSSGTSLGPLYIAVTNPDGQYISAGIHVIIPESHPEISVLGAPTTFSSASTLSVGWNMNNLTRASHPVDVYLGLLLPTSDAIFHDGTTFTLDLRKMRANQILEPGFFLSQDLLAEIPLGGAAIPSGDYLWFAALAAPDSYDFLDISLMTIRAQ